MQGFKKGVASLCQAEDGIRGYKVTGVQTCALPISNIQFGGWFHLERNGFAFLACRIECSRSEERRVGKEGRSRWSPYHSKKTRRETRPPCQRCLGSVRHCPCCRGVRRR